MSEFTASICIWLTLQRKSLKGRYSTFSVGMSYTSFAFSIILFPIVQLLVYSLSWLIFSWSLGFVICRLCDVCLTLVCRLSTLVCRLSIVCSRLWSCSITYIRYSFSFSQITFEYGTGADLDLVWESWTPGWDCGPGYPNWELSRPDPFSPTSAATPSGSSIAG